MEELSISNDLDALKKQKTNGIEFWMARDIQVILGYQNWQNFESVIERAKSACESTRVDSTNHFISTSKVITGGKGAQIMRTDYFLSRYACYLTAMNGNPAKPEIAMAQGYFAVQTRRQELADEATEVDRRLEKRLLVKKHNRHLAGAAKGAGVKSARFGIFQDRGYIGLYTMSSKAIKAKKGIPDKDNLLDYAGCEELAANDFRITQTARRLTGASVKDEQIANAVHEEIGRRVRQTIKDNQNPMPEDLPAEPHIKTLMKRKSQKELKAQS
jgi:DNA-damage-inducible protein D